MQLQDLRLAVRRRADMENSTFISDTEFNDMINSSAQELYDILVSQYGEDYNLKKWSLTTVSGQEDYALPSDFYKLRGVDWKYGLQEFVTLRPFQFAERNRYRTTAGWNSATRANARYRVQGNNLALLPVPNTAHELEVWYLPKFEKLVNNNDVIDGVNGFEEYVIVDAAIKALQKEESDVQVLLLQKQQLEQRITRMAGARDANEAFQVPDVREYRWRGYND
jgi:hypothetical protein